MSSWLLLLKPVEQQGLVGRLSTVIFGAGLGLRQYDFHISVDILLLANATSVYLFLKISSTCTFAAMIAVCLTSFCNLTLLFIW